MGAIPTSSGWTATFGQGREAVGVDRASPGVHGLAPWRADDHVRQPVRAWTLASARNVSMVSETRPVAAVRSARGRP